MLPFGRALPKFIFSIEVFTRKGNSINTSLAHISRIQSAFSLLYLIRCGAWKQTTKPKHYIPFSCPESERKKKKEKHKRKPYILKFTNWKLTKLTLIEETEENWSMADEWNEWNDCRYHRYIIQLVPLYRVFNTFNNAQFQLERLFIHWKISPRKETKVKRIKWLTIKKKWS